MCFKTVNTVTLPGDSANSAALENTRQFRTSRGRLLRLKASNFNAADLYLQIHDKAAALAPGDIPIFVVPIAAGGFVSLGNMKVVAGLSVALSTTIGTYTAPGSPSGWFHAEHK